MIKEAEMEEVDTRIDMIIRRALLITSNEHEIYLEYIYSEDILLKLVIEPIIDMCYEKLYPCTRTQFFSNVGALGRCTKIISADAKAYLCTDCTSNTSNYICEECFMNSNHMTHNYVKMVGKFEWLCHCGNSETYNNSPPYGKHKVPENSQSLPWYFVKRIKNVIRHLFRYLELICDKESALDAQVENLLHMSEIFSKLNMQDKPPGMNQNMGKKGVTYTHSWCLLIFKTQDKDLDDVYLCLIWANLFGNIAGLLEDFETWGYMCVKYRDSEENCRDCGKEIQKFIKYFLPGSRMYCKVVKVHKLFFMRISRLLVILVKNLCTSKSIFCDYMSEILFTETTLPEKFFFNRGLWNDIREYITNYIFLPTLFSRNRGMNLVKFYWQNFDRLSSELFIEECGFKICFFRLSMQILTSKRQFRYLIINGFLSRVLNLISPNLKSLGLGKGKSISKVLMKIGFKGMNPIYDVTGHFYDILHSPVNDIEDSGQVISLLLKATNRLMQFIFDFDDMEPLTLKNTNKVGINPAEVIVMVCHIHYMIVPYIKIILKFDDIADKIIRKFVDIFKRDMERVTANQSTQQAIEKLITLPNIEQKSFSIFNLSQRVFWDILTQCVVGRKLSDDLKKTIFEDPMLLLWISQAAITSLSFEIKYKVGLLADPSNYLSGLISGYHNPTVVHHLFMQDFNAIQFLISFLRPEHFLKYLLFNICPSIREKTSVSQSLSSILALPEFEDTSVLQQVFILIYNALTEMRLVHDLDDPYSYFIKRQCMHMRGYEYRTDNVRLRNVMKSESGSLKSLNPYSDLKNLDRTLLNTSSGPKTQKNQKRETIFTKYSNPGSPFYYLNTTSETEHIFKTLLNTYKNQVPKFLLPDVTELREEFKGLDEFMFSETFLDFIIECFVKWYNNSKFWGKDSPDLFLFILLCVCLILRVSQDRQISESHRERIIDFFGPQPKLKNRTLTDIVSNERPNSQNPMVEAMINRFLGLSRFGQRNPKNI